MKVNRIPLVFAITAFVTSAQAALPDPFTLQHRQNAVLAGLSAASPLKTAAVEFHNSRGRFPTSTTEAGATVKVDGEAVSSVELVSADSNKSVLLKVTLGSWAFPSNIIMMRGDTWYAPDGRIVGVKWECGTEGTTANAEWLPPACLPTKTP